ncbi:flagellar basal-body rod protein FlgG [Bacillus mesophilus]|uniref:Flagellar hook-basal body protein n=1 Tax=Bacillus mesophilus TaxID=1808955 RepID=A0A6M0Q940_9BACI|nr:flagellar hook-basal body protein [Bacillus mesophilus]MBM7662493.1 flagellar basal-body rod protein FlgG [Bacillus mesophilus]NEY72881.1 flagellar hook-basal body protein [Bacillus mesophilus]
MLRGFYTAASGMLTQQKMTELLTNNMANANTPGFKADQASVRAFPELLLQRINNPGVPNTGVQLPGGRTIGALNSGAYLQETIPNFIQGDLQDTGRKTDIALQDLNVPINVQTGQRSSLFFHVQDANGESRYTRNGNFTIDGQGFLTTNEGFYVLNENNERIMINSGDFTLQEDGTIIENNQAIGRLNIVLAENPNALVKEGNGLFRTEDGQALQTAIGNEDVAYSLKQGFVERSNVDAAQTMTQMLTAFRAFEANQKVLQAYDKSMDKAVNEIGRL